MLSNILHYFGQSQYPWKTSNYEWFADINIFGGLIVMEYVIILYTLFTYVKGQIIGKRRINILKISQKIIYLLGDLKKKKYY